MGPKKQLTVGRLSLDAEAMHRAAQAWIGRHDFASFETSGSTRDSTVEFTVWVCSTAPASGKRR